MTPDELARRNRNFLIRTEKESAVLLSNEFEALKRDINKFLIENAGRIEKKDLTIVEKFLTIVEKQIETLSAPFQKIVSRAQKKVVGFTSRILKSYFPTLETSIFEPDTEAIQVLIGRTQTGESLQKAFARLAPEIADKAKAELVKGFAAGESNNQIAKRLKDVSGIANYNALRISRTETNEAYRAATREFYDRADIKKYVWKSVRDHRTCLICWFLHNQVFKTNKKVFSHPQCRCVLVPFAGEALEDSHAGFLRLETGFQKQILGKKRFELFEKGNLKLSDFVRSEKSEENGTMFKIKNLSEFED